MPAPRPPHLQMYVTLVGPRGSRLARPALCLALLAPAFLLGVVRVAEHRNHWADILAGFLTGTAVAAFLVSGGLAEGSVPEGPGWWGLIRGHSVLEG